MTEDFPFERCVGLSSLSGTLARLVDVDCVFYPVNRDAIPGSVCAIQNNDVQPAVPLKGVCHTVRS
jgi:hypothetical protein